MWAEGWGHLPGQLVAVSGPSGTGKSTMIRHARAQRGASVGLSVSATTRERREGESERVDYFLMEREALLAARDRAEFLEWAEYSGNLYGTPAQPVFKALGEG